MGKINEIKASARVSFKQPTKSGDVFYTFEYSEARSIDETKEIENQKTSLWNDVNNEINNQVIEIKNLYLKN